MRKARDRSHEFVCKCGAYRFPHRQFGGACSLGGFARRLFDQFCRDCIDCMLREGGRCQVCDGIEDAPRCPALQEHIAWNEITLYARAKESFMRAGVQ